MKAHEVIIRLLEVEGVDTIFTLMSEDTMSLMSALESNWNDSIRMVKTRHEQGAIAMADGYSRATNGVGVCLVGRGPAVAQTGTALVTAKKKGSNVLTIVPEAPISEEYDIKEFEQKAYLRSTVENIVSIRSHDTLVSDFRDALRRVKVGDGPLAVQVPWDILDGEMDALENEGSDRVSAPQPSGASGPSVHPNDELIKEAVDLYLDSDAFQPPVILAGRGAIQADAKDAIEELAKQTSSLLATSLQGRNYFSDHPFYLGFTGSWGSNLANQYVNESDLVFAIGIGLNPYTVDKGYLFGDDTKIIHIDTNASNIGRYTDVELGIQGDARVTAKALSQELDRQGIDRDGELWSDKIRNRIEESSLMSDRKFPDVPGTMDPRELVMSLDQMLPDNKKVVTDAGHFTRWVMDGIQTPPEDFTFTLDFAAIGLGMPMGIGTALAVPNRPCVTICGDAGLMMSIQELETAVRNEIPMIIIVMNDSSLGSEYHSLAESGQPAESALVSAPDFADVAQSFGAEGYTARNSEELEAISDKLGQPPEGPVVVDCKVNHEVRHRSKM